MKHIRKVFIGFITALSLVSYSQEASQEWRTYFAYNTIIDVVEGDGKLYAASENAIFIYDPSTNENKTLTTIEGLSGDDISTIFFSEVYQLLVIGYNNGLLQVYNQEDNSVTSVVDILNKENISPNAKKINHINELNEFIYIASDFGVSVYNLERLEFDDTYFIGFGGTQIQVLETAIFNGFIYAACQDGNGFKKALLTSENLIDFQQWAQVSPGNFRAVSSTDSKLFALANNNIVYEIINDVLVQFSVFSPRPNDLRIIDDTLIITQENAVNSFNSSLVQELQILRDNYEDISNTTTFNASVTIGNSIYIATNDSGVLAFNQSNLDTFSIIKPDGPLLNDIFSIEADPNGVWVTYGKYSLSYDPQGSDRFGISHLKNDTWFNISRDSIFGAGDLNKIAVNPFNLNQAFVSSFRDGVLEINNNEPSVLYNQDNSGLESLIIPSNPNVISIRVSASSFDRNGLYWCLTGRTERPLKSYDPTTGTWQGFSFADIYSNPLDDEPGYGEISIDNAGTKWIGGLDSGLVGYSSDGQLRNISSEDQNMPSPSIYGLAVDQRNQVWIGTNKGLRVLFNTSGFFNDPNPQVSSIIILEDGLAQELLFQQFITDIEVDGSNNKWIATADIGVFYVSENGQETIYHFTKDNSPLPSNNVVDISINETNGRVFLATSKGLLSFDSGSSQPLDTLEEAFIYPNPVRPGYNFVDKKITIKDISENVNIKITDIEGNLVAEAESNTNLRNKGYNLEIDGGTAFWNGKNLRGSKVASGVYLVMLTDLESLETKVLKLMVVR